MIGKIGVCLVVGGLIFAAGVMLGRRWPQRTLESHAEAVRQADGSLVLERNPEAKLPVPVVPAGARVERQVEVVVRTHGQYGVETLPTCTGYPQGEVNPQAAISVRVRMTLVRMADGTMRVIASSPDGEVVGGIDVPVQPVVPALSEARWQASVLYTGSRMGAAVTRNVGRCVVGAGAVGGQAWVSFGFSW